MQHALWGLRLSARSKRLTSTGLGCVWAWVDGKAVGLSSGMPKAVMRGWSLLGTSPTRTTVSGRSLPGTSPRRLARMRMGTVMGCAISPSAAGQRSTLDTMRLQLRATRRMPRRWCARRTAVNSRASGAGLNGAPQRPTGAVWILISKVTSQEHAPGFGILPRRPRRRPSLAKAHIAMTRPRP